jgi:hypothetical protein
MASEGKMMQEEASTETDVDMEKKPVLRKDGRTKHQIRAIECEQVRHTGMDGRTTPAPTPPKSIESSQNTPLIVLLLPGRVEPGGWIGEVWPRYPFCFFAFLAAFCFCIESALGFQAEQWYWLRCTAR